jgi:hypothetical protein
MRVVIEAYNPAWPDLYKLEEQALIREMNAENAIWRF